MGRNGYSIKVLTALYFVSYLPYIMITRYLATVTERSLGRPLTGLELLPSAIIVAALLTYLASWRLGWFRDVHRVRVVGLAVPFATRYTFLSGLCCAVIITAVPLSYTLSGVSIPFIQLLMRGDILLVAPLVDILSGRRVRWWSLGALALVAFGMLVAFHGRGSIALPPAAIAIVLAYTAAFFGRLAVMTHIAKDGDPDVLRTVFLEERIVAFPTALIVLALLSLVAAPGGQGGELQRGFVGIWAMPVVGALLVCGVSVFATGIFSTFILLDKRENSFCVPLERSASVLAGVVGSVALAGVSIVALPSGGEFAGAALLIAAIVLLSLGPRWSRRRSEDARASG